jgi:hypothetical protein
VAGYALVGQACAVYHRRQVCLALDTLDAYTIRKAYLFEQSLFEHTGVHVMIAFFERKPYACREVQVFEAVKVNHAAETRCYRLLLEHLRALTDSEFMTTYKYSASAYTRKYLGLSQAKVLIETFPYLGLSDCLAGAEVKARAREQTAGD